MAGIDNVHDNIFRKMLEDTKIKGEVEMPTLAEKLREEGKEQGSQQGVEKGHPLFGAVLIPESEVWQD